MPFSPSDLSSKLLWLRGKDLGASGSTVTSWPDQSGLALPRSPGVSGGTVATGATPSGGKVLRLAAGNGGSMGFSGFWSGSWFLAIDSGSLSSLFDNDATTGWTSVDVIPTTSVPHWVRVSVDTPMVVTNYTMRADWFYAANRAPRDFKFQGSNDASTWTDLDTQTGITWANSETKTFSFSNSTAYIHHRVAVTLNGQTNGGYTSISELRINGNVAPSVSYTGNGEMWMVVKSNTDNGSAWGFGTSGQQKHYTFSGQVYSDFGNGSRRGYTPSVSVSSAYRLLRMRQNSGTVTEWIDGTQQFTAAATASWPSVPGLAGSWSGDFAEVLFLTSPATTTEAADLITYFNTEHGLTVPGGSTSGVTGVVTATIPALTTAVTGQSVVTGQVAAAIGAFTGSVAGSVTTTGQVAASVAVTGSVAGSVPTTTVGAVAATIQVGASVVGEVASIVGGAVDATIAVTAAVTGAVTVPGLLRSGLPLKARHQGFLRGSQMLPWVGTLTGSKVLDFSYVPTVPECFDPWVIDGDGESRSLWVAVDAIGSITLTASVSGAAFAYGLEAWLGDAGDGPDDIVEIAYAIGPDPIAVPLADGQRVFLRVHPLTLGETGTATLTWDSEPRMSIGQLQLEFPARVLETPIWASATVFSGTAGADVEFAIDAEAPFFTVTLDEDGVWSGDVPLPGLTVDGHLLRVTDLTSTQTAVQAFTVQQDVSAPSTLPTDNPPATPGVPDPVIRWVFEDPAPGGVVYRFPINPSTMSNPLEGRVLTAEHSLAATGQSILWEGTPETVDWSVDGSIETQAHYEAMQAFLALDHRFWVIDHHQRAFVVSFESLDLTEKKSAINNWAYSYRAKFLILAGPVALVEA